MAVIGIALDPVVATAGAALDQDIAAQFGCQGEYRVRITGYLVGKIVLVRIDVERSHRVFLPHEVYRRAGHAHAGAHFRAECPQFKTVSQRANVLVRAFGLFFDETQGFDPTFNKKQKTKTPVL